jgi:GTPase Era involved in 16S rRNA processing
MWWLLIPPGIWIGKKIYDAVTEDDTPAPRRKSTLEQNIERLKNQLHSHSGRKIAIIGQPGAGKSSLLKKMTNGKVVPLPVIGTQTDATSWADDSECNLLSHYEHHVFVDVPGYDTSSHPVHVFSTSFPFDEFDAFIFVIHGKLHSSDENIFRLMMQSKKPLCVARSFSDSLEANEKIPVENDIRVRLSLHKSHPIFLFSNRTGEGIEAVFNSTRLGAIRKL